MKQALLVALVFAALACACGSVAISHAMPVYVADPYWCYVGGSPVMEGQPPPCPCPIDAGCAQIPPPTERVRWPECLLDADQREAINAGAPDPRPAWCRQGVNGG